MLIFYPSACPNLPGQQKLPSDGTVDLGAITTLPQTHHMQGGWSVNIADISNIFQMSKAGKVRLYQHNFRSFYHKSLWDHLHSGNRRESLYFHCTNLTYLLDDAFLFLVFALSLLDFFVGLRPLLGFLAAFVVLLLLFVALPFGDTDLLRPLALHKIR